MRLRTAFFLVGLLAAAALALLGCDALRSNSRDGSSEQASNEQRQAAEQAALWLMNEAQNDDGGYASFGSSANASPSTIAGTLDAVLALAAADLDPAAPMSGQTNTPITYLTDHGADVIAFAQENGGQAGKVILALTAAGLDPRHFAGHDFAGQLSDQLDASGSLGATDPFKQAVAILGLVAAGQPVPAEAVDWLVDRQAANGSWDDGFGTVDNPDATAMAIMALVAAGRNANDTAIASAVEFLAAAQGTDGGWAYGPGLPTSANSTSLVVQALSALDEDWTSTGGRWAKEERTPLLALLSFQSESGAFQADIGQGPVDDIYATVQAVPAVVGQPFPLIVVEESGQ
jgi:hypothetical protein